MYSKFRGIPDFCKISNGFSGNQAKILKVLHNNSTVYISDRDFNVVRGVVSISFKSPFSVTIPGGSKNVFV